MLYLLNDFDFYQFYSSHIVRKESAGFVKIQAERVCRDSSSDAGAGAVVIGLKYMIQTSELLLAHEMPTNCASVALVHAALELFHRYVEVELIYIPDMPPHERLLISQQNFSFLYTCNYSAIFP